MASQPSPLDFYDAPPPQALPPAVPPASGSDIWAAARTLQRGDRSDAEDRRIERGYKPILEALGIDGSQNPVSFSNDGVRGGALLHPSRLKSGPSPFGSMATRAEQEVLIAERIRQRRAAEPDFLHGIPDTAEGLREYFLEQEKQARAKARETMDRGEGFASGLIGFAGGVTEAMLDPVNVASLPLGGGGKTILSVAGREALVNGLVELGSQPIVAANRAELGEELTLGEAAANVAMAATGGAVLGGAAKGVALGVPAAGAKLFPEAAQARRAKAFGQAMERVFAGAEFDREAVSAFAARTLAPEGGFSVARSIDAGTIDARAVAETFRAVVPDDARTPDQQAALNVIEREAEIAETSPYEPGMEGDLTHGEKLAEALQTLLADNPHPLVAAAAAREPAIAGDAPGPRVAREAVDSVAETAAFKQMVRSAESGGDDGARNPRSSAQGRYQFTDDTFVRTYRRVFDDGATREAILARKLDPALQERLMDRLTADNAAELRKAGQPVTAGNLYLLHFAGDGGGRALLRAAPDTPVERILGAKAVAANPEVLAGKSASEVIAWAHGKMGRNVRSVEAGSAEPRIRGDALIGDEPFDVALGPAPVDPAADWRSALHWVENGKGGHVDDALYHPALGDIGIAWGRAATEERPGFGIAAMDAADRARLEDLDQRIFDMEVESRSGRAVILAGADGERVRVEYDGRGWQLAALRSERPFATVDVKAKAAFKRRGPVPARTFLADLGGIADNEGHDLAVGRGLAIDIPFAGKLIRDDGMSLDAAGERLWEAGYFGPAATTNRPSIDDVIALLEREEAFLPEDVAAVAERRARAGEPSGADIRGQMEQRIEQAVEDFLPWITAIDDEVMARAVALHEAGEAPETAYMEADAEIAAARRAEAGEAADTSFDVPGFDDPIAGPEARAQADSLDHDLRMELAYHGSPHLFDRFSTDKIGTGEGFQSFGWGLYFTETRAVAETYRLVHDDLKIDGRDPSIDEWGAYNQYAESGFDIDVALADNATMLERDPSRLSPYYTRQELLKKWKGNLPHFEIGGALYTVKIPAGGEYLLWDEPLSMQPKPLLRKLDAALKANGTSRKEIAEIIYNDGDVKKVSGEQLYRKLEDILGTDQAASLALHEAGINGIKYLDGGSRANGEGTFNYVLFDDQAVKIVDVEGPNVDRSTFRLAEDGDERALAEIFEDIDADTAFAATLRSCM